MGGGSGGGDPCHLGRGMKDESHVGVACTVSYHFILLDDALEDGSESAKGRGILTTALNLTLITRY